ncbi:hypothetical protein EDC04DRAFT_2743583 [Pisolithus marmoratus]|nr:hypothetical protein EDC04DRAFT_2743583 [Pisolithus marmoratus]
MPLPTFPDKGERNDPDHDLDRLYRTLRKGVVSMTYPRWTQAPPATHPLKEYAPSVPAVRHNKGGHFTVLDTSCPLPTRRLILPTVVNGEYTHQKRPGTRSRLGQPLQKTDTWPPLQRHVRIYLTRTHPGSFFVVQKMYGTYAASSEVYPNGWRASSTCEDRQRTSPNSVALQRPYTFAAWEPSLDTATSSSLCSHTGFYFGTNNEYD